MTGQSFSPSPTERALRSLSYTILGFALGWSLVEMAAQITGTGPAEASASTAPTAPSSPPAQTRTARR